MILPRTERGLTQLGNPVWLIRRAFLWIRSCFELRSDDVIFAFYPKTGSTWVRIFFYNLLSMQDGGSGDFTFDEVNRVMPEFGNSNFFNRWPFQDSPRLVKTHRGYNPCFAGNRAVLFIRDPKDIMVSYLHYARAKTEIPFSGDLRDLVYHRGMGLRRFMEFYRSWVNRADLLVRYEDLRGEPIQGFRRLCEHLELDVSDEMIATALERSTLEKTRVAQAKSSKAFQDRFEDGFVFARKGSSGEGSSAFNDELNTYYRRLREWYNFSEYSVD